MLVSLEDAIAAHASLLFGVDTATQWWRDHGGDETSHTRPPMGRSSRDEHRRATTRLLAAIRALRACVTDGIALDQHVADLVTASLDEQIGGTSGIELNHMALAATAVASVRFALRGAGQPALPAWAVKIAADRPLTGEEEQRLLLEVTGHRATPGEVPEEAPQPIDSYLRRLAEEADRQIHGPEQLEWINRIHTDLDNVRAALQWCVAEENTAAALRLLNASAWPWNWIGSRSEVLNWLDTVRAMPRAAAYPLLYARLLSETGRQKWLWGDISQAKAVLEESHTIALSARIDGEPIRAMALRYLGIVHLGIGEVGVAQPLFEESLKLYERLGDQPGVAFILLHLGKVAGRQGQYDSSLSLLEQSLALHRQAGDLWGIGRSSQALGQMLMEWGDLEAAQPFLEQHLSIDQAIGFTQGAIVALANIGELCRLRGNISQAQHYYETCRALAQEHNLKFDESYSHYSLGMLALHRNDHTLACLLYTSDAADE